MTRDLIMELKDIQPSQLYISSQKLDKVLEWFNPSDYDSYDAIPIKKLNGKIIFIDGHTRAYAAYLKGIESIKVYYWEEEELSWDAYQICIDWCDSEGIKSIHDLKGRVINPEEYETLWNDRCRKMQKELGIY
ncbi:hypothetical protein [Oceanirhabdus sp. W0125-5]|uniref:hypothetical protein n=1 Tax=Oceanirhabdus sp. W0125-5 TaxID=2999116 RepID=UPI0022F33683|nr:hypothetical protein [Oceanirhabdus sp. W0125-5]WBW96401.1 hypothetical protein OW730_22300 [Oceanirhabdus sp. W0125-5]